MEKSVLDVGGSEVDPFFFFDNGASDDLEDESFQRTPLSQQASFYSLS